MSIETSLLDYFTGHKALMIFHNYAPNGKAPAILELLVMLFQQVTVNQQAKNISKNHTASPENFLYWLLSNT